MALLCLVVLVATLVLFFVGLWWLGHATSWPGQAASLGLVGASAFTACFHLVLLVIVGASLIVGGPAGQEMYRSWTRLAVGTFFDVHVESSDRFAYPARRPVIFLVNHMYQGYVDIMSLPVLPLPTRTRIVHGHAYPPTGSVLRMLNGIEITHGGGFDRFIRTCSDALAKGDNLLIFPQGRHPNNTRHRSRVPRFQTGTFVLSHRTRTCVIPITLIRHPNWYGLLRPGGSFEYRIGESIDPAHFESPEAMRDYTWQYMNSIPHDC